MTPHRFLDLRTAFFSLAIALPVGVYALPEDDAQQVQSEDAASIELSLNEGEVVQTAHADRPTCVKQGSRKICGAEIRFQRNTDGTLRKVTATGTPASFEQRPAADQEIVHFSGRSIIFDQGAQLLTIDGEGRLSQGNNKLSHEHIEYHLDSGRIIANGGGTDVSGQMQLEATGNE